MTVEEIAEDTGLGETLIKAFPAPDLRRKAEDSTANPCASARGAKETLI